METRILPARALAALERGDRIGAIKAVRAERGLDLKDAKDAVDAYVADHPHLGETMAASRAAAPGQAAWWIAAAAAFLVLAYVLYAKVGVG